MEKWFKQLNNTLVVAPHSEHHFFLMLKNKYPNVSFKLITKEEILSNYYGTINEDFYSWFSMHQDLSFPIAKLYYKFLSLPLKKDEDEKVLELYKYRKELLDNRKIKVKPYYDVFLRKQKILIFDYSKNDPELCYLFDKENVSYEFIELPTLNKNIQVTSFEHIDQEIAMMYHQILDLYCKGIPLSKIFIYSPSKEYHYPLIKLANDFKIPLEDYNPSSYYSLSITKEIIEYYRIHNELDSYKINNSLEEEIILEIKKIKDNYSSLLSISNFLFILKDYFSNKSLTKTKYVEQIKITNRHHFLDDEYVFVLGFEQGKFPFISKDDDYLLDSTKERIHLLTSKQKNKLERDKMYSLIYGNKNVFVSYKHKSIEGVYYPSILIKQYGLKENKYVSPLLSYSIVNSQKEYARILDFERKYGLSVLGKEKYFSLGDIGYRSYSSLFKGSNAIKEDDYLIHSYSKLKIFAQCPYHYYLDNILKLSPFEETSYLKYGNLVHLIMEHVNQNIDFEEAYKRSYQKFIWTNQEKVLLSQLKKHIELLFNTNKKHYSVMENPSIFVENSFEYVISSFAKVVGKIDKIIVTGKHSNYASIIDFKTGDERFVPRQLQYGYSMQLPIYSILLKGKEMFEDLELLGVYIQKAFPSSSIASSKKTKKPVSKEQMLNGVTLDDRKALMTFDPTYVNSLYIRNMKVNNDGHYGQHAKIFTKTEWSEYENIVLEKITEFDDKIRHNAFDITPVEMDGVLSCKFCPYKDVCYVNKDQIIKIKSSESEEGDIDE